LINEPVVLADLGNKECPFTFSEEIQEHNHQFQEYRDFHGVHEIARKLLDTDSEGWISPQLDYELKQQ
jgi:hypothetical protein